MGHESEIPPRKRFDRHEERATRDDVVIVVGLTMDGSAKNQPN